MQRTNLGRVVGGTEYEFGCAIISRTDVGDVGLILHQNLCATEVAQLENTRVGVKEQVLGLDIAMADALGVDIGQGSEKLVDEQLDLENWHGSLHLVEEARRTIDRFRHKLLYQVQVDLIFLLVVSFTIPRLGTYFLCLHVPHWNSRRPSIERYLGGEQSS